MEQHMATLMLPLKERESSVYGWVTAGHIMTTDNAFWVDRGCGDAPGHGGWRQKKQKTEALKGEDVGVGGMERACLCQETSRKRGRWEQEWESWSLTPSIRLSWIRLRVVLRRLLIRPRLDDSYCKTHTDMQTHSQSCTNTLRKCEIMHTHKHAQRLHSVGAKRIL